MKRYVEAKLFSPEDATFLKIGAVIQDGGRFVIHFDHSPEVEQRAARILGASFYSEIETTLQTELTRIHDLGEDPLIWLHRNSTMYLHYQEPRDFPPEEVVRLAYRVTKVEAAAVH